MFRYPCSLRITSFRKIEKIVKQEINSTEQLVKEDYWLINGPTFLFVRLYPLFRGTWVGLYFDIFTILTPIP